MTDSVSDPPVARRADVALGLFVATCVSVFYVGAIQTGQTLDGPLAYLRAGASFAVPFLSILVCHELGHFLMAQRRGVPASYPYFLPLPLPPIGTLGAVIGMPERIGSRNTLLDVGAAGPLAGLVVALPVLAYGIATSPVVPIPPDSQMEGRSLVYWALLFTLKGDIPAGQDILLNPVAFAGWAGLLVTMINLVPVGQLDGGHVAYALFGPRQNGYAHWVRRLLFVFGGAMMLYGAYEARNSRTPLDSVLASASWVVWALLLTGMARAFGKDHPSTDPGELSAGRKRVAWLCLALFVLLFMPRWLVPHV